MGTSIFMAYGLEFRLKPSTDTRDIIIWPWSIHYDQQTWRQITQASLSSHLLFHTEARDRGQNDLCKLSFGRNITRSSRKALSLWDKAGRGERRTPGSDFVDFSFLGGWRFGVTCAPDLLPCWYYHLISLEREKGCATNWLSGHQLTEFLVTER